MSWKTTLSSLIAAGGYTTQSELVSALAEVGHSVTQTSVSRELGRQRIRKVGGEYRLPDKDQPPAPVYRFTPTAAGCIVVLHTDPGFAPILGLFIDEVRPAGVIGTIAGDDTVLVATTGPQALQPLADRLGFSLGEQEPK